MTHQQGTWPASLLDEASSDPEYDEDEAACAVEPYMVHSS